MKKLYLYLMLFVVLCGLAVASAFAQTPTVNQNCTILWDAYVDPLAATLKLYITKDGVSIPAVTNIPKTSTSLTCKAAGITQSGIYKANLHAVDAAGTESDPSNGITFQVVVKASAPTGLKVQ